MATNLDHIQSGEIHKSALQAFCNSTSIGPLEIKYCVDLTIPQVSFEVFLAGIKIGGGTVDPNNTCITVGGSVLGFTAQVELCLDVTKQEVTYDITLCVPILPCDTFKGVLFSW